MKITYHKGPVNNVYCKIITQRGESIYDIDGIPKRGRFDRKDRLDLYLQILGRNFSIPHTHLIFLIQKLAYNPSKRIIEDDLNFFEKKGYLDSEKTGDSRNSGRFWSIKHPEFEYEKITKNEVTNIISSLEKYIKMINKKNSRLNNVQKDFAFANLFSIIHAWQPIVEIISQETRIKTEKRKFDSLVKEAYNILKKSDDRDYVDGRPFLRRLLHLKASQPMVNMNEFLDEIK